MYYSYTGMRSLQPAQHEQRVQRRGHAQRGWKPLRHRQHSMRCTIVSQYVLYQLMAVRVQSSKQFPHILTPGLCCHERHFSIFSSAWLVRMPPS